MYILIYITQWMLFAASVSSSRKTVDPTRTFNNSVYWDNCVHKWKSSFIIVYYTQTYVFYGGKLELWCWAIKTVMHWFFGQLRNANKQCWKIFLIHLVVNTWISWVFSPEVSVYAVFYVGTILQWLQLIILVVGV